MQSNVLEQARLEAAVKAQAETQAMRAVAARLDWDDDSFVRRSHRAVEGAVCAFIGVAMTTLALYNLALWLMR